MSSFRITRSGRSAILTATLVASALDILAAFLVYSVILEKTTPARILRSIASGLFGQEAFTGGTTMVLAGLVLHFVIAALFAAFYYIIFPYLMFLRRRRLVSGVLYGIFVWMVMNFGVLPVVFSVMSIPDPAAALLGMAILIVAVGIPIAYIIPTAGRR